MKFSIIVPAHNEERFISKCLSSIVDASREINDEVEIMVVLNRCTDKTEEIAKQFGAVTINENAKNLSKIRNAEVNASTGDVIVTIDADSWMKSNMLREIKKNIGKDNYIGGGVQVRSERVSLGIFLTCLIYIVPVIIRHGISLGSFWCHKKTFQELDGFNENLLTAEDIDFAIRLKKFGKAKGKQYKTINTSFIVTSCRKWDLFGDWYILKNSELAKGVFKGINREIADKWWYDVKR
jgi:glycosyltransferase involved in cell wall biosynthesis